MPADAAGTMVTTFRPTGEASELHGSGRTRFFWFVLLLKLPFWVLASITGAVGWRRSSLNVEGLQGSLLQVDIAQIIVDEADEPNSLVDLLDTEPLTGKDGGDIDFLSVDAATAAGGDKRSSSP
jgi:hypothetical protein